MSPGALHLALRSALGKVSGPWPAVCPGPVGLSRSCHSSWLSPEVLCHLSLSLKVCVLALGPQDEWASQEVFSARGGHSSLQDSCPQWTLHAVASPTTLWLSLVTHPTRGTCAVGGFDL